MKWVEGSRVYTNPKRERGSTSLDSPPRLRCGLMWSSLLPSLAPEDRVGHFHRRDGRELQAGTEVTGGDGQVRGLGQATDVWESVRGVWPQAGPAPFKSSRSECGDNSPREVDQVRVKCNLLL